MDACARVVQRQNISYLHGVRSTLPASPFFFVNPLNHGASGRFGRPTIHNLVRKAGVEAGISGRPPPLAPHQRDIAHPTRRGHPRSG